MKEKGSSEEKRFGWEKKQCHADEVKASCAQVFAKQAERKPHAFCNA